MTTAQFRINTPHVIQETIEGEAIIVNMVSGNYYSIAGVGSVIWDAIVQGRPTAAVAASIVAGFDADPATGRADLDRTTRGYRVPRHRPGDEVHCPRPAAR